MRHMNKFYVDKAQFAANLLNVRRAELHRPPRSGKTLFANTLKCLFDVSLEDQFGHLFRGLHVTKNKPRQANQLYVLKFLLVAIPRSNTSTAKASSLLAVPSAASAALSAPANLWCWWKSTSALR
eukprot:INCI4162.1.p1 GENE.INCI4162.1~~INCI4162.1.p1  ORF type:complete len:125 (-),score=19.20 INCI4162.1:711-1085(-)